MKWQPIETAPKNEIILVHWSDCLGLDGATVVAMLAEDVDLKTGALVEIEWLGISDAHSGAGHEDPTHWMALPEPPTSDQILQEYPYITKEDVENAISFDPTRVV